MLRAQIEIVFSPAREDLASVPGLRHDAGGFVYRIRNAAGRVHIAGSHRGLDPLAALAHAKGVAKASGYTHWRGWNAGGPGTQL